jgi:fibronectin type 3 domain-containing protein
MTRLRRLFLCIAAVAALGAGCSEDSNSPVISVPQIPVPFGLNAVVGTSDIVLSWQADTSFTYSGFVIYRSENSGLTWDRISESTTQSYADSTVRTGVAYLYGVAGVNSEGVEGKRSTSLVVVASFFSIQINDGDVFTNLRDVFLRFSAPGGTQLVRFSEDPSLAGVAWQTYTSFISSFILSAGDEPKHVFSQFKYPAGFTTDTFSDTIILDTQAAVESTSYSPSSPVQLGVTLHFAVTPLGNELDGGAWINIETFPTTIVALDDGTNGDPVMDDGVYETNVTLPSSFRGVDLLVSARFTDAAGNTSAPSEFANRLTFTDPPAAVTLFPAVDSTTTSISIRWSESADLNFDRYEVYRDQSSSVDRTVSPRVATISTRTTTDFRDSGLLEAEVYYYKVYVVNDLDEYAGSNVRMAETADFPPVPVDLDEPSAVGADRLTLTWSMNNNTDFQEYKIYRAEAPGVTLSSTLVATIDDQFQTFFDDSGLDTTTKTYYYRVWVFDKGGNSARSNEVSTP